jgi:hypothetical protein
LPWQGRHQKNPKNAQYWVFFGFFSANSSVFRNLPRFQI